MNPKTATPFHHAVLSRFPQPHLYTLLSAHPQAMGSTTPVFTAMLAFTMQVGRGCGAGCRQYEPETLAGSQD